MSIGDSFWSSASAFARSRFELPLFRKSIILSGQPSFEASVTGRQSTRHPAEMRVNFDYGCSGEHEKSDYGPVDTKRDCFRRSSRAPPDSFSQDNESNFFSLPM
ncbi:hypothetical protein ALC53_06162 [Atta colombica]|uniref:Uncharacterized protein n=1 Tax=Atta colombica TaxID=520822 RepID=A0A195BFS0_9HYME|nr:hypothetical protein ALC53_06162 [Atta colombica]